jgi:hypothetical protein
MKCSPPIEAASLGGLSFCGDGHGYWQLKLLRKAETPREAFYRQ